MDESQAEMIFFQDILFQLVKYRIHISAIFFFLLFHNNKRVSTDIDSFLLVSFTLWHFALFLFDRVYDRELDKYSQPDEYVENKHFKFLYASVGVLLLMSLLFYYKTGYNFIYWLFLLPITFLYPLKVYRDYRVKNIFFVKNLYSALFIFCLPLLIQLYLLSRGSFDYNTVTKPILSLFFYVLIGEVFWDIRDASVDRRFNIKTIPNTFGINATKIYILVLILLDAIITNSFFSTSAYIYIALLTFVKEDSHRLIFHLPPLIALTRFLI